MDERSGVLTKDQEVQLDNLIELEGLFETFDGPAIKLIDNQVIERLKVKIPKKYHEDIYGIVDIIFDSLPKKK